MARITRYLSIGILVGLFAGCKTAKKPASDTLAVDAGVDASAPQNPFFFQYRLVESCGYSVVPSVKGDLTKFFFVGWTNALGRGLRDALMMRTNQNGKLEKTATFGGDLNDVAVDIREIVPGEKYLIVGITESYGHGKSDGFAMLTDANFKSIWPAQPTPPADLKLAKGTAVRFYGGADDDEFTRLIITSDGNAVVIGNTPRSGTLDPDVWLMKFNVTTGDVIWSRTFGGAGLDLGQSLIEMPDRIWFSWV